MHYPHLARNPEVSLMAPRWQEEEKAALQTLWFGKDQQNLLCPHLKLLTSILLWFCGLKWPSQSTGQEERFHHRESPIFFLKIEMGKNKWGGESRESGLCSHTLGSHSSPWNHGSSKQLPTKSNISSRYWLSQGFLFLSLSFSNVPDMWNLAGPCIQNRNMTLAGHCADLIAWPCAELCGQARAQARPGEWGPARSLHSLCPCSGQGQPLESRMALLQTGTLASQVRNVCPLVLL